MLCTLLAMGAATDARSAPTPPITGEMHARYLALAAARDAVIAGEVPAAVEAVGRLTAPEVAGSPFPEAWRPMDEAVRVAARRVTQASDVPVAADRVAEVAVACASCHTATGGGPVVSDADGLPTQAWVPGQNMPLHRWAVDWMWLGLVADSDEAWLRGAQELDDRPMAPKFEGGPTPQAERARQLEQQVYALAKQALTVDGNPARAALMGDLLATCASCHANRPAGAP
jgi:cytochrome c553